MFRLLSRFLSNDIAIDLGTANTLIFVRGKGIVLDEPSMVAIQSGAGNKSKIMAVGTEAKKMQGRAPRNIEIVRPMRDGVIADFVITERMLGMLIKKATEGRSLVPPRVVICVPGGSTQVERKAILDSAFAAGAASVHLIEEPMAAALGAGLPIEDAAGSMIVDAATAATLGLHALSYVVMTYFILNRRRQIMLYGHIMQLAAVLAALLLNQAVLTVARLFLNHQVITLQGFVAPFVGALLWPILSQLMLIVTRIYRSH